MTDTSYQWRTANRIVIICILCLCGLLVALFLSRFGMARVLAAVWTWQDGVVLVLVLGWATWVEVGSSGTTVLVLLRIITALRTIAVVIGLCLFVSAGMLYFTPLPPVLGLSYVALFILGCRVGIIGFCPHISVYWGWFGLPLPERHRLYEHVAHLPGYRRWRQSFFHENAAGRSDGLRPFGATVPVWDRWLGWAGILAALLLAVAALSLDIVPSSHAILKGLEVIFFMLCLGLTFGMLMVLSRTMSDGIAPIGS